MNQEEINKEYANFTEKLIKKLNEINEDLGKLSNVNKKKFMTFMAQVTPMGYANLLALLKRQ